MPVCVLQKHQSAETRPLQRQWNRKLWQPLSDGNKSICPFNGSEGIAHIKTDKCVFRKHRRGSSNFANLKFSTSRAACTVLTFSDSFLDPATTSIDANTHSEFEQALATKHRTNALLELILPEGTA